MGGVNCPPPATQGVSPAMMDAYVDALASYSGNLFRGISQVFAANEMVEARVIARDDQFKAVSDVLDESQTSLAAAKLELGTVASLWQAMGQPPISSSTSPSRDRMTISPSRRARSRTSVSMPPGAIRCTI